MSKGLEALKRIKNYKELTYIANITGFERVNRKLAYNDELKVSFSTIEKELKEKEELEKAFDSLSKENEKAMKELSKEIEKNRALEILRECNLTIDEFNKKFDFISGKVPKDKVDSLKEVLL